jgi:hypothetical protein
MRAYLRSVKKERLIVYAFLYAWFFGRRNAQDRNGRGREGEARLTFRYSAEVTKEEHVILQWAVMYERHAKFGFRSGK